MAKRGTCRSGLASWARWICGARIWVLKADAAPFHSRAARRAARNPDPADHRLDGGYEGTNNHAYSQRMATERDCHPDSIAEAFRRRITVLERQQIIGRGRGLRRTADNPLHVLVLTDVPLDMPVEEPTTDAAERPSFEDRQIAVGAIAFECAAHAAKAFPEMWKGCRPGTVCAPTAQCQVALLVFGALQVCA